MDNNPQRQQTAERVKQANNVLVTVSNNPSVDQLAACIGLTLALNRLNKHATAVFSGEVPNVLEFLQPEKTLEKNTDSLRDFIIALDKSKADKLRYKVEDKVVKVFITPYRTSITEKDLQFSQGDFNVDAVIAIGVHNQRELDQAITAHGRILHDATVITMNTKPGGELGSINWLDQKASSLSELAVQLIDSIDKKVLDSQIATALLTGIVAETKRFSNDRTSPLTMSYSAELMSAGANQQLVATKLEPKPPPPPPPPPLPQPQQQPQPAPSAPPKPDDGVLEISHGEPQKQQGSQGETPEDDAFAPQIHIDQEGMLHRIGDEQPQTAPQESAPQPQAAPAADGSAGKDDASTDPTGHMAGSRKILQPPSQQPAGPAVGAPNEQSDSNESLVDPLSGGSQSSTTPMLQHNSGMSYELSSPPAAPNVDIPQSSNQGVADEDEGRTLSQIEQDLGSPHAAANPTFEQPATGDAQTDQPQGNDGGQPPDDDSGPTLPPPVPPPFTPPSQ